ncbi:hypothetical protein B296_00052751 [Ensete ventricosum]|uniref:Uncharacterized protein n=1 Tax=Ensete ventricosum TaxID=4639 RepID=A0A426XD48_ENSVE|nr:hypothetical protein B296_00052751 [Ensete ventricosum]
MATSSSPSAAERARFFFAATLLLVMLLAAPKPTRSETIFIADHVCCLYFDLGMPNMPYLFTSDFIGVLKKNMHPVVTKKW